MGVVEVAVVGLIGFVGLLVLVSILLMDRVLKIEKRVATLEYAVNLAVRLGAPAPSLDPLVDAGRCGPACRTEMAGPPGWEKAPWCATHRRWWAPEGPRPEPGRCTDQCPLEARTIHEAGKNALVVQWCATHHRAF